MARFLPLFFCGEAGNALVTMPCFGTGAFDSTRVPTWSATAHQAAPTPDALLVERNSDVDHRIVEVIDQDRLPGQEVYPIEAGHPAHNQRREATIGGSHAVRQSCVDVEPDRRVR